MAGRRQVLGLALACSDRGCGPGERARGARSDRLSEGSRLKSRSPRPGRRDRAARSSVGVVPADERSRPAPKPRVDRSSVLRLLAQRQPDALATGDLLGRHAGLCPGTAAGRCGGNGSSRANSPIASWSGCPAASSTESGARAVPGTREPGGPGLRARGQRVGAARSDHPADVELRRRRRGRRAEAQPAGLERHVDARAAAGAAGDRRRHHPVVRRARRPGRAGQGRGAGPRDQPGPGRHGVRPGDRHRRGRLLLLLPQSRRPPGPGAGRAHAAGHRARRRRVAAPAGGGSAARRPWAASSRTVTSRE